MALKNGSNTDQGLTREGFEALFREYFPALMAFSGKFLPNEDDAREVVQHVFINLWERRDSVDISDSLKSYLFRSVHNRSLNMIRDRKKISEEVVPENFSEQDVSDHIEQLELEDKIKEVIRTLPEKCRVIFELSRFEGMTYGEIAGKLNISVKTVENQMSKALKILRQKLINYLTLLMWILWNGLN